MRLGSLGGGPGAAEVILMCLQVETSGHKARACHEHQGLLSSPSFFVKVTFILKAFDTEEMCFLGLNIQVMLASGNELRGIFILCYGLK